MTEAMKDIDLRKVDRSTLRDRSTVRIDPEASTEERIRAWIEQLGNPYVYLDGGVVVKLSFADKGETIEDRINSFTLPGPDILNKPGDPALQCAWVKKRNCITRSAALCSVPIRDRAFGFLRDNKEVQNVRQDL